MYRRMYWDLFNDNPNTQIPVIFYMLYKMKYKWMGSDYVTCMGTMYMYFPYLELEGLPYS